METPVDDPNRLNEAYFVVCVGEGRTTGTEKRKMKTAVLSFEYLSNF